MCAPTLAPIFRSDLQLAVLASLYLYGGDWTITELAEHAGVPLSTASREVRRLIDAGLASVEQDGTARRVRADFDLPWVTPLIELLDQTVGAVHHFRDLLEEPEWAAIDEGYIFGSWARRHAGESGAQPRDLDVVLISGQALDSSQILQFQRALEHRIHLPVDAFDVRPIEWEDTANTAIVELRQRPIVPVRRLGNAEAR